MGPSSTPLPPDRFATTRWSVIVTASDPKADTESRRALAELCEAYWEPVYLYVRRRTPTADDAADATQEFFAYLLTSRLLETADRERGRFRAYLLTALKRFLGKEREKRQALKRGGGTVIHSLDTEAGEARFRADPADEHTPESLFERRWALTLLDRVLDGLRLDYVARGDAELFDRLKATITNPGTGASYREAAEALGRSESAIKVAVHRLRGRYRERLRSEIAETLADPNQVDEELRDLARILSKGV